jgi:hypothetical protein
MSSKKDELDILSECDECGTIMTEDEYDTNGGLCDKCSWEEDEDDSE